LEIACQETRITLKIIMTKMKLPLSWSALALATVCFLMTGCVARRIAWSPDGAHAAIFAGDGLHLCGPDGALSETILPGDGLGDWFSDSRRLAVVSAVEKQSWPDMQKLLPPQDCERVEQGGKTVLEAFKAGHNFPEAFDGLTGFEDNEKNAVAVFLAQSPGTKEVVGTNWDVLQQGEANVIQIRIGTLDAGKLSFGASLVNSLRNIVDIRVSPTGVAVAYTVDRSGNPESAVLMVVPADGAAPPLLVAKNASYCADWSPDGRSLLYVRAVNPATSGDQLCLGSLTRTVVLNAAGRIEIQPKSEDLVGLLFDINNEVRRLSDGRIIFAAAEVHLPCTSLDMPQQPQLFALDPERQTAVIPLIPRSVMSKLPDSPSYYEPSPDGKRIAISADKGAVVVLTLATGALETVQAAGTGDTICAPAWRSADELCFISTANGQPAQVSLRSNGTNKVLSANWPQEARKGFLDK
jgi:hypothetical protein